MSKKKDLAKKPDQPPERSDTADHSDIPDPKITLAVLITKRTFDLLTIVAGVVWCVSYVSRTIIGVAGSTTDYNFNFVVNIAVTLALTGALSAGPMVKGRRERKRADHLSIENDRLREKRALEQERADGTERRAEGLAADLKALRKERDR